MKRCLTLGLGATLLLLSGAAGATTMIRLENAEMAGQADAIVIGRCASATTEWVGGTLMTLVEVRVGETLKGSTADALTLVIPGGVDASRAVPIAVTFPGAPTVLADEEVLLFLNDSNTVAGGYDTVGFNQGKFTVLRDAAGAPMVSRGGSSVPLDLMRAEITRALEAAQ